MLFQNLNPIIGRAFVGTILTALGTRPAGAVLGACKVRLSKAPSFVPNPASVISDFTGDEADFSGYTPGGYALTWTTPVNGGTNVVGSVADALIEATTAGPFIGNECSGMWVDDGTNVVLAEAFPSDANILFAAPGIWLSLAVFLPFALLVATGLR